MPHSGNLVTAWRSPEWDRHITRSTLLSAPGRQSRRRRIYWHREAGGWYQGEGKIFSCDGFGLTVQRALTCFAVGQDWEQAPVPPLFHWRYFRPVAGVSPAGSSWQSPSCESPCSSCLLIMCIHQRLIVNTSSCFSFRFLRPSNWSVLATQHGSHTDTWSSSPLARSL